MCYVVEVEGICIAINGPANSFPPLLNPDCSEVGIWASDRTWGIADILPPISPAPPARDVTGDCIMCSPPILAPPSVTPPPCRAAASCGWITNPPPAVRTQVRVGEESKLCQLVWLGSVNWRGCDMFISWGTWIAVGGLRTEGGVVPIEREVNRLSILDVTVSVNCCWCSIELISETLPANSVGDLWTGDVVTWLNVCFSFLRHLALLFWNHTYD